MLNFIYGRACTGKTYNIINKAALASADKKVVVIVPEQFTFETERAMLKYENAVQDNICVLSFSRIFDFVSEAVGRGSAICVSEFEKMIFLKKALTASSEQLSVFSRYIRSRDFLKSMSNTIRDLKFAGVSIDEIYNASVAIGGTCGAKLKDISIIMSAYEALLNEKYIDPADLLTKLYEILCDFDYFSKTDVFFDSFTGFTGQQYKIIKKIMEQADNVTFAFSAESPDDTSIGVFYNTCAAINKLKSIAASLAIDDIAYEKLEQNYYSNSGMCELEKLMYSSAENCKSNGNISVISCENTRQEALAAANIIRREVKDNGYRFKDFIVVARNADDYDDNVLRQCDKHGISCYSDRKFSLAYTPLCVYVVNLIEASASMNGEKVIKLLKSELLDISEDEVFELENYLYTWDIDDSDWANDWDMSVKGITSEEDHERDIKRLNSINLTRQKVFDILTSFKKVFFGSAENRSKAIFNHLISNKIDKKLANLCDKLNDDNEHYYSSVTKQSWDRFVSVLDSLVRVLDKGDISASDYLDSMLIALDAYDISNIPQMLDEVTFGSADRIKPSKPKISIILGANQDVFPHTGSSNGLLAPKDKDKLKKQNIDLNDDAIKSAVEENFLVYSMVCCPVDKTYILYAEKDAAGDELAPSLFVTRIVDAFKDISIKKFKLSSKGDFVPATEASAFGEIGNVIQDDYDNIKCSLNGVLNYTQRLDALEKSSQNTDFSIKPETADNMFGKNMKLAATGFDMYHKCSLSYLLKNGFYIKKLQKAELGVLERGNITHFVLEKMVEKYKSSLGGLSPIQISAEVDVLIDEYFKLVKGSEKLMTARFSYLLDKIATSVKNIVVHLSEEFAQSDFEPKYCEVVIGDKKDVPALEYTLDDGTQMKFEGRIDRVDVYKNYVRVIDYKTGKMTFKLSDTLAGLNMQMLLYLYAFVKNGQVLVNNPKPAGILYMPAKYSKKPAEMRMNGILLDSDEIRSAMEKDNKGLYIPKSADLSSYLAEEGFDHIFGLIDQMVLDMGNAIKKGEFAANPTDSSMLDACKYCDFSIICRSSGQPHNVAKNCSNDDVIKILKGDTDDGI